MPFSCQHNDIPELGVFDAVTDRFPTIWHHYRLAVGFLHSHLNIRNDVHYIFITRVIGSDDRQICQTTANLAHLKPAYLWTVSTGTKQTNQPIGMVLPQRCQYIFHGKRIMGIVDQQGVIAVYRNDFHPSFYFYRIQSLVYFLGSYAKMAANRNGCQRIINAELARNTHLHLLLLSPVGQSEAHTQITGMAQ